MLLLLACTAADSADTAVAPADTEDSAPPVDTSDTAQQADDDRVRALTGLPEGDDPCAEPWLARVLDISDGDTFWVDPQEGGAYVKIRMIGIDTPEISHDGDPADCYGQEAWDYTIANLADNLVWLTHDAECQDDYDRTLAYVFRDDTDEGFFNRNLVRNGYATHLTVYPNDSFEDEIRQDEDDAEREGLGLWSACD